MFVFLPVWHKETEHVPGWTLALIGANLLIFFWAWPLQNKLTSVVTNDELLRQSQALCKIALGSEDHLEPTLVQELEKLKVAPDLPLAEMGSIIDRVEQNKNSLSSADQYEWDTRYPVFRGMMEQLKNAPEAFTPYSRYGLISGGAYFPRIFTHQFLHQGWLHLLGNMLFLFIAGSLMEQRIGGLLPVLYLSGGAVAALAQLNWADVPPGEIMVGASGAISALIGFALAYVPSAKVTMFYLMILSISPKFGTIDLPAWFVIPVWVLSQALLAHVLAHSATNNVAFMAHLGGCAFGFAAGLLLRVTNPPIVKTKTSYF